MTFISNFYHKTKLLIRVYKYSKGYDKDEIRYVINNLSKGNVAFDIGAHKGAYAFWMRKVIGTTGKVICIEPQPILFDYLVKVFKIFGYINITVLDCAVSEKDSEGQITVPGKLGNISQGARIDDYKIIRDKHKDDQHTINVKIRSVDSIVQETGLKPHLIKIDVEGHEFSAIKGMSKTLKDIRPKIIVECEARHIKGFTVFDIFKFIIDRKYQGFFYRDGKKISIDKFDIKRDQLNYFNKPKKLKSKYIANFIFEPVNY